jgi:phosphopantothenoylcysteine decarboxylase/phosphopantothenate--cysteine ligase
LFIHVKILITAGPTREWLDPVRFMSNPATGRLGYLLAAEGRKRGHEVVLVSGPTQLEPPAGVVFFPVESAREMAEKVLHVFPEVDCLFMTAAVSDWRPRFRRNKIKHKSGIKLTLFPNPDILSACGKIKRPNQVLIGFALETRNLIEEGKKKMREKWLDYILVNDPNFFGKEKGRHVSLFISRKGKVIDLSNYSKEDISRFLFDHCLTICSNPSLLS